MKEHDTPCNGARLNDDERQRFLWEQLPQVRYIARRIHERLPRHVPLEDLVHAGVVGLIDALDKFDIRKKVQFRSYAKYRIRGAIIDSLREMDWSPRDLRRQARLLERASDSLRLKLGRDPSEMELAGEMVIPLQELQRLLADIDALDIGSFQMISTEDGKAEDLTELLSTDRENSPLNNCLNAEMKELMKRAIEDLPERERQVLSLYYFQELTMKEIGALMGVGESRVSQIHSMAVLRMRTRIATLTGDENAAATRAATAPSP